MKIDEDACTGCEICHPYCPVGAIGAIEAEGVSWIIQDTCVECGVCLKADVCPTDAIYQPELEWPRSIRAAFSNPKARHPSTGGGGRGTAEMKTNDVTGRYRRGFAGVGIEMGRPGISASFRDLQTVTMALSKVGVEFEQDNPVAAVIVDKKTGKVSDEVLDERVLSAIIECKVETERLGELLKALREASTRIDTVCSVGLISRLGKDGSMPNVAIAEEAGFTPRPNTKTNVGLGRPLKEEA
jgi:NAD-dependent dihydropyrimidine dehydrogenase PreA subunit